MSGGSYDYLYLKIEDMADSLRNKSTDSRRTAFAELLRLVAQACQDIEWVDSCDYAPGAEHAAIDAVFSFLKSDSQIIRKAQAYDAVIAHLQAIVADGNASEGR